MLEKQFVIIGNVYVPCFSESFQHHTENYRILSFFSMWGTILFILSYFYTWKDFFRTVIKHLCTNFTRHEGDCCNIIFLSYCCMTIPQESWMCLLTPERSLTTEGGNNSTKTVYYRNICEGFSEEQWSLVSSYITKHTPKQMETCWGCIHRISWAILRQLTEEYIFFSNHLQCIDL